jgi:hypothetical protein
MSWDARRFLWASAATASSASTCYVRSGWPSFEHCLTFGAQRRWDEPDGIDWPRIWTAERDGEVWARLQD